MRRRTVIAIFLFLVVAAILLWRAGLSMEGATKRGAVNAQATQMTGHQHDGAMPAEKPAQSQPQTTAEETPTVEISLEKQQLIGVRTAEATVRQLQKIIRTVGLIEYDQTRVTTVNTKVEGWIEKLYVNFSGAYVKKGQPLVDLYSPELWATQQEFINVVKFAKAAKGRAPKNPSAVPGAPDFSHMLGKDADNLLAAARQRLKLWDISEGQIKKIEESEQPVRTLTIYSPVSGYVLQKQATQGMKVTAGEKLFDVADLSIVWINADIYEYELPLLKVGDAAVIQLSYFPGREYRSRIDYIYPTLSGETRTAKVRFSIPNEGGALKPQMFMNVGIKINLGRKLAAPEDAVIDTGIRQIVYVDRGEGHFEPREVTTGVRAEKLVEITNGLKAGEKIASSANFLIDSEAKLKGVEPLPHQKTVKGHGSGAK